MMAVAGAMLTGCGPNASSKCDDAFKIMEAKADRMYAASATAYTDDEWNALEFGPLNACKGFGDWLDGAKDHPGALGFTHADAIDIELLPIRCNMKGAMSTTVCLDMDDVGLL